MISVKGVKAILKTLVTADRVIQKIQIKSAEITAKPLSMLFCQMNTGWRSLNGK